MMRHLICVMLLSIAFPAGAETARVISGDHEGFSRLVVELPGPSDWRLGRTLDGYALAVATAPDGYDLAGVFDLIRRDRLAAVSVEDETGNLLFGLACACHAIPFEFRPGVIVIDIRDGAPPEGSSFELPLPASTTPRSQSPSDTAPTVGDTTGPELAAPQLEPSTETASRSPPPKPLPEAPPAPSRWVFSAPSLTDRAGVTPIATGDGQQRWPLLEEALQDTAQKESTAQPAEISGASAPMTALRDDLLMEISRGAARGVVDLAPASPRLPEASGDQTVPAFPQVAIEPVPGLSTAAAGDQDAALTPDGARCIADALLNIGEWGQDGPVATQVSTLTNGIIGEFDAVNADALSDAVRLALHLGFGVEAIRLLQVFPSTELAEAGPLWISMGRIIDGYPDPDGAFAAMATCDTAAALWAVLALQHLPEGGQVNAEATLRSFSALPLHLRLSLGPTLAERFLAIGRDDLAQAVRGAIERAPDGAGHEADLIGAKLDLARGDHDGAATRAKDVIADAGPGVAEAMLALVQATLARGKPVDPGTADALAAILRENHGAPLEADLTAALILASASGGNADAAFGRLPDHPEAEADLWAVLAETGTDNDLLRYAIRPVGALPATATAETVKQIAERLRGLGFADEAAIWSGADLGDTDVTPADAVALAVDPATAAEHAWIWARDWKTLAEKGSAPWQDAARHVASPSPDRPALPPLAKATALLDDAAKARADIGALLAAVETPIVVDPAESP